MRVNNINPTIMLHSTQNQQTVNQNYSTKLNNQIAFKTADWAALHLAKKGVKLNYEKRPLPSRNFVSRCVLCATSAMEKVFGKKYLPKSIVLGPLGEGVYGQYDPLGREITYNSECSSFDTMARLAVLGLSQAGFLDYDKSSTLHPAHVYIHELAHSAHWEHLVERHGEEKALKIWTGLVGTQVPNSIGRIITRFALGRYAVDSMDMGEFVAERITQDVCNGMPLETTLDRFDEGRVLVWGDVKNVDAGYSDIYSRKHNYRYSSPSAYLDYFMQQVWNGDITGAQQVGRDAEVYLESLSTNKVPDSVVGAVSAVKQGVQSLTSKVADSLSGISIGTATKDVELSEIANKTGEAISKGVEKVSGFFSRMSEKLDSSNVIKINKWW